jgi:hypothetical protein
MASVSSLVPSSILNSDQGLEDRLLRSMVSSRQCANTERKEKDGKVQEKRRTIKQAEVILGRFITFNSFLTPFFMKIKPYRRSSNL